MNNQITKYNCIQLSVNDEPGFVSDPDKPAVLQRLQKDFKSPAPPSDLKVKLCTSKQSCEEVDDQPPAKKKKIDLIFKDVLEASLEESSKSRSRSCLLGDSDKKELQLAADLSESRLVVSNLKAEESEENLTGGEPSTSFCPNCVKLKQRILELEEELSHFRRRQDNTVGPSSSELQPDPPHPEQAPIEDFQGGFKGKHADAEKDPHRRDNTFTSSGTWLISHIHLRV